MSKVKSKAEIARLKRLPRADYNRKTKERTRSQVLAAGLRLAKKYGLSSVKRNDVALEAECANGSVNFHFKTMVALHNEIVQEAIRTRALRVVAEAIVGGYAVAEPLRSEALASYK